MDCLIDILFKYNTVKILKFIQNLINDMYGGLLQLVFLPGLLLPCPWPLT